MTERNHTQRVQPRSISPEISATKLRRGAVVLGRQGEAKASLEDLATQLGKAEKTHAPDADALYNQLCKEILDTLVPDRSHYTAPQEKHEKTLHAAFFESLPLTIKLLDNIQTATSKPDIHTATTTLEDAAALHAYLLDFGRNRAQSVDMMRT